MEDVERRLAVLRRTWVAFFLAPVLGAVVVALAGPEPWPPGPLAPSLASLGGPILALLFVLRFTMLGPGLGLAWLQGSDEDLDWRWTDGEARRDALERYTRGSLVGWALAESIAAIGLVAWALTGSPGWFTGHLLGCWALLALQLPLEAGVRAVR